MDVNTPLTQLHRVGDKLAKRLKHLGLETVEDLLFHFPFRYEDYSQTVAIKDLHLGEQVTVKGRLELIASKRSWRTKRLVTEAIISDGERQLRVVWFGQPFISKVLKPGDQIYLSGKVGQDMLGPQMISPSFEKVKTETTHTARIVPMYSLTSGLTQKQLRFLVSQALKCSPLVVDWLPVELRKKARVVDLVSAIKGIHFPSDKKELSESERRLKFDELFVLQLRGEWLRQSLRSATAPVIPFQEQAIRDWVAKLPFVLTRKQKVAAWEILQDISQPRPMNRLLEGDVGSGKTVVAALAIYNTVLNKQQAILMAPTEILARQHFQSLTKFFAAEKISIGLLTRSQAEGGGEGLSHGRARKNICQAVKNNELAVLIGTQALLNEDIDFASLGLVIVDEQHRFGVSQRKMIREKSGLTKILPHFLSLTATPIPRSFALTLYGDLDLSIIDEMPKGRKPVLTRLVEPQKRQAAYDFIQKQIRAGHQVFVICPLIAGEDEGMASEKKTVMTEYEKLSQKVFPDLSVGYLHGRMKAEDKAEQMKKFATNQIQILVSTSVVEVGVDIPNATVMMIEGAEKFGLAQLHQFRGRVGRSDQQSYCLLFTESETETARERLHFFASTTSGFKVAEYDLQQRGPGEVYGLAQSGLMNFRLATMRDQELIKLAREMARGLNFSQYPELVQKVKTWEQSVHWE